MLNTIENKAKWLQTNCRPNRGCATLVRSKFRQKIFKKGFKTAQTAKKVNISEQEEEEEVTVVIC